MSSGEWEKKHPLQTKLHKRRYYEANKEIRSLKEIYECIKRSAEWQKNNKERHLESVRARREAKPQEFKEDQLLRKFDISIEEYNKLLIQQDYCCAICVRNQNEFSRALAVDHCHKTGKIRGLLCVHCNTSLGGFKDSIELLDRAKEYLLK